ncbi:Aux/IAA-ARF-dimerization [Artemisia annua]|nr:Aux/IAA-ARF-dimerization [Artemisia annua]
MSEVDKGVNWQLWHACAGGMVQMPLLNSNVYYFPQGHAEHTLSSVDFSGMGRVGGVGRVPAFVLCKVVGVRYLADFESDEVYAKIRLVPLRYGEGEWEGEVDDGVTGGRGNGNGDGFLDKMSSFAKTLTQSDANNGGGFSVPRYCAETIFPRLDYSADPPVQTVVAKDVHGEIWKFRHIYRGTPRRHLLTTGWSSFVNQKKLVAGDSIVFVRTENGEICVGIRRAKRGGVGGPDSPSGWNSYPKNTASFYGAFPSYLRENENKLMRSGSNRNMNIDYGGRGKVRPEDVIKATTLAANGQPFEVAYYPRACTPDFCVKASTLTASLNNKWCPGMRFKMAFETEDSSRISWFMGTVSSVEVADPFNWPNSPWRLLQVNWDEPDLLQNVKRVSPWLVEVMSSMPHIHLAPFSPQRKKLRLPQPPDLPQSNYALSSSFSGIPLGPTSPFGCLPENIVPGSIQGARHAQFGIPLLDLNQSTHKLQLGHFPSSLKHLDLYAKDPDGIIRDENSDDVSCVLTMGSSSIKSEKSDDKVKPLFILFGQPIHIDHQISSDHIDSKVANAKDILQTADHGLDTGHCKIFLESEDIGRTIDLSVLESYEELERKLANLFGIKAFNNSIHVLYKDSTGDVKRIGDEPFSVFVRKARSLTIPLDACNQNDKR